MNRPSFSVIIPAAGTGTRSGLTIPKQYGVVVGKMILTHTVAAFDRLEECRTIVIAIDDEWRETAREATERFDRVELVTGGSERQYSIASALTQLSDSSEIVLVHDAARPRISTQLIERVLRSAAENGAAIPVLPISETVKRVDDSGFVRETVDRSQLVRVQTPQGFRYEVLIEAYARAADKEYLGTDDASLVEQAGYPVAIVEGEAENIKVTWKEDLEQMERLFLLDRR